MQVEAQYFRPLKNTFTEEDLESIKRMSCKDSGDKGKKSVSYVPEYVSEINKYQYERQKVLMPRDYISSQKEINKQQRAVLVDWMIEVSEDCKLHSETLFISVNILDRYLSVEQITKEKFQLLGITCLFVASKYEENRKEHMPLDSAASYCLWIYSTEEIIQMERKILNALSWNISSGLHVDFLRRYLDAANLECGQISYFSLVTPFVYFASFFLVYYVFFDCLLRICNVFAFYSCGFKPGIRADGFWQNLDNGVKDANGVLSL